MITKAGKFWVDTDREIKNRCIVSLVGRTVCYFAQVNVMFGTQLDKEGWSSIYIDSSKFFVNF